MRVAALHCSKRNSFLALRGHELLGPFLRRFVTPKKRQFFRNLDDGSTDVVRLATLGQIELPKRWQPHFGGNRAQDSIYGGAVSLDTRGPLLRYTVAKLARMDAVRHRDARRVSIKASGRCRSRFRHR